MRYLISNTAEYGDIKTAPRIITDETKAEMKRVLADITSGRFVKDFVLDNQAGQPELKASRLNHIDIDADADNYVTYIRRVASQLKQNTCDLAAINVYVVRQLDARLRDADLLSQLHYRQPAHRSEEHTSEL